MTETTASDLEIPGALPLAELARRLADGTAAPLIGADPPLAYLMLHRADLRRPEVLQQTAVSESSLSTADVGFLVLPLKKRVVDSSFPYVSVGRTKNNDIALVDVTISKFHAFFRAHENVLHLQDAGSRNGTFVDEVAVPARGEGPAVALRSRSTVRFGSVALTFALPAEIVELGQALSRRH